MTALRIATTPPAMTLDHWQHHRFTAGDTIDRWTLTHEGRTVLTFGTEFEARSAARRHGWVIVSGDALDAGEG